MFSTGKNCKILSIVVKFVFLYLETENQNTGANLNTVIGIKMFRNFN